MIKHLKRKAVPIIYQMGQNECGPACLAMIMKYYGSPVPLYQLSEQCGANRDGVNAVVLKNTAEKYGYSSAAFKVSVNELRNKIELPVILHFNNSHYVVLEGWHDDKAKIVDPAKGKELITMSDLQDKFNGIVLKFTPNKSIKKKVYSNPNWYYYKRYIGSNLKIILAIVFLSFISQLLSLTGPLLIQELVDNILLKDKENLFDIIGMIIILIFLFNFFITYSRIYLSVRLQRFISTKLSTQFIERLFKLPLNFFEQRATGDLASRMNNIFTVREILARSGSAFILDITMLAIYGIVMFKQSILLTSITFIIAIIQVILMLLFIPHVKHLTQRDLAIQSEIQSYLMEAMRSIILIKTTGKEEGIFKKWSHMFTNQMNVFTNIFKLSGILDSIISSIRIVTPILLIWVGIQEVLNNNLTIGELMSFSLIAMAFLSPMGSIIGNIQSLQLLNGVFERLNDVMNSKPEQINTIKNYNNVLSKSIILDKVNFSHSINSEKVLQEISLTINPGEKVALVGATGSGKTTLLKLILGLYRPTEGNIIYGDIKHTEINYKDVRKDIGVVLQDTFLFNDTIENNLCFFDKVEKEQLQKAICLANLEKEIERMPLGLQTIIGENGQNLSGGQRQRLAIARAIVKNPSLLILDEATSQLDTHTEQQIHENIEKSGITTIVIAHRLTTIKEANQIFVIDNGYICERGNHEQLIKEKGLYYNLWKKQVSDNPQKTKTLL
ncbi:peptidase domain-containing ABC transporter [Lysinibacillus sp. NPDC094403]|uniref:peptidase domain-containing ABC transporter n=1 Tax=Lysinibacillus sp. NPDC094403 TaxID=3390581 RepID=UPI003CFC0414